MEEWRSIKSYEGIYEVSSWGRVRSVDRYIKHKTPQGDPCESFRSGVVLRAWSDKDGYKMVALQKDGKVKRTSVHRLVAESFIPNPDNLPCVNHKDENPTNNHVSNLEWCTNDYNVNYGTAIERSARNRGHKIMHIPTGRVFSSKTEAQAQMHVSFRMFKNPEVWKVNP